MSIDDHGLEAIRKSAHLINPSDKSETYILSKLFNSSVTVNQGTSPWVTRQLTFATDKVDVSGSSVTIPKLNSNTDSVTAIQGTTPWVVTFNPPVAVTQSTNPWVISDLNSTKDSVTAKAFGHVSTGNSTSTPLGAGATFTGAWEDVLEHVNTSVHVTSNVQGTLYIEKSTDGVNTDGSDTYVINANAQKEFSVGNTTKYMRVRYTNDGSPQSFFRLQTINWPHAPKPSSHRLIDNIVDNDDVELIKAILSAKKPNGDYTNINATAGGNLKVSVEEFDGAVLQSGGLKTYAVGGVPTTPASASGSLTAINSTFIYDNVLGFGSIGVQITGTWVGTITASVSIDGATYVNKSIESVTDSFMSSISANGLFTFNLGGVRYFKLTMTAYTSGTATISAFTTMGRTDFNVAHIRQNTSAAGVNNQTRLPTIETEHQKIHEQKLFHYSEVFVLGSGIARNFVITPLTNTAHWIFNINGQDGLSFALYEFSSLTGFTLGAAVTAWNKARFGTAPSPTGTIQIASAIPALPTPMQVYDTGTASNIQKSISRSSEWDLAVGKFYLFRVVSNNASNTITLEQEWYEG